MRSFSACAPAELHSLRPRVEFDLLWCANFSSGPRLFLVMVCVCLCVCSFRFACLGLFVASSWLLSCPNVCAWRCFSLFWCSEALVLFVVLECVCGCVTYSASAGWQQIHSVLSFIKVLTTHSIKCTKYHLWVSVSTCFVCLFDPTNTRL